jgi:hypothetical protein
MYHEGIRVLIVHHIFHSDNRFNPTVSQQCLARVHRYGQTKPVRCYRFAIENSVEATVYARSENKVTVSKCILDGFFSEGIFSSKELNDFYSSVVVETCGHCGKSRILPAGVFPSEEDEEWFCEMNQDPRHMSCDVPQEERANRAAKRTDATISNTNDPLTKYLASVHNEATRRTGPIVSSILPVEVKNESGICAKLQSLKLEKEIAGEEFVGEESEPKTVSTDGSNTQENLRKRKIPPDVEVVHIE